MVSLLSRQLLLPKPDNALAVPPQLHPRAEPPQVLLEVGAAANRLDAAPNVLEERVLRVLWHNFVSREYYVLMMPLVSFRQRSEKDGSFHYFRDLD